MAVKSKKKAIKKVKTKAKPRVVKTKTKTKAKVKPTKAKSVGKKVRPSPPVKSKESSKKPSARAKPKSIQLGSGKPPARKIKSETSNKARVVHKIVPRVVSREQRKGSRGLRLPQYNYMRPPGLGHDFQVGDTVEVYCDHEKNKDRIRGWIRGIIVQVDNKMVAVQFRSNVYLTDGWMVPDRILWYPLASEHMRPVPGKKVARRESPIPDY